jgi:hypothetical protein
MAPGCVPFKIVSDSPTLIDASCQVWLHLAKLFQRRRFFLTLANQKKELILATMFVGQSVRQPHPPFKMAAVFKGNDYLPLKFASVSFYCQVNDTGSVG